MAIDPNTVILGIVTGFSSGIGYTIASYLITRSLIHQMEKFEKKLLEKRRKK